MIRSSPTNRRQRLTACFVVAITLGASGCGGDDPEPLTVADLSADAVTERELRNELFSQRTPEEWTDDTRLTASDVALYRTVATVYFTPELRRALLLQSLDDWDDTAASLRTRMNQPGATAVDDAGRDQVIEEIRGELERAIEPDADVDLSLFLAMPAVDRMIVELESEYASSGLGEFG